MPFDRKLETRLDCLVVSTQSTVFFPFQIQKNTWLNKRVFKMMRATLVEMLCGPFVATAQSDIIIEDESIVVECCKRSST